MSNIQLVLTDVDDTLVKRLSHTIDIQNLEAIQSIQKRGGHIALASARPSAMLEQLVASLGLQGPQIIDGGATLYDFNTQQLLIVFLRWTWCRSQSLR